MSTDSFASSADHPVNGPHGEFPTVAGEPAGSPRQVNQQLIHETRNQIRALVDEIAQLAESGCSPEEFYQGFLTRTTSALASLGGAIWRVDASGRLQLEYHVNLADSGIQVDEEVRQAHLQLLNQAMESGEPTLIPPRSGFTESDAPGNLTENLLILGPLTVEKSVVGLLEIFQRAGAGPTTQRGYLRFVVQMCKVASDFLRNHQLRTFAEQQAMWQRMRTFVREVHASLNPKDTAYAIVNEGRRVIDCDRVSVALRRSGNLQIETMSGLDTVERRADQVKRLGQLATSVARGGQPLWYAGDDSDLPPQIERQLHEYLDIAHAKLLVIQPLHERRPSQADPTSPTPATDDDRPGPLMGALIIEQLGDESVSPILRQRIAAVAEHSRDALTNAIRHHSMFLAPLWTWLGKTTVIARGRNLPKTVVIAGVVASIIAMFCLVPYPFTLRANGQLTPEIRTEIFASVDGVLQQILVPEDPDELVEPNQVLAVMTNNDLMVEIQNLQGQLQQAQEKVKKLQRAQASRMDPLDHRIVEGDLAEAIESRESLNRQVQLKLHQAELLNVRSPTRGRVVNWQLRQNLMRRPVQRGQNLMTIVDPDTPWQVELEFPERRVAHLLDAVQRASEPLAVTFTLASHPGQEFDGQLLSIDNKLDVRGDQGNAVLVRIAFDKSRVPADLLRSGTRVTAHIQAGSRSLGYVWFHELFETAHSTWQLWF